MGETIPFQLHEATGHRSRMTNREKQERQDNEAAMSVGDQAFTPTPEVKQDPEALKKWNELVTMYTDFGFTFVTTADTALLAQYCLTYSEYIHAVTVRRVYLDLFKDDPAAQHAWIEHTGIDTLLNKKNELLVKIGQRLYLDPVSRIAATPKGKLRKKSDPLKDKGLDNV